MNDNWVKIHSSIGATHVELLKSMLEDNSIKAIILSRKDSMIPSIGEVELYVKNDDVILAKHLIEEALN